MAPFGSGGATVFCETPFQLGPNVGDAPLGAPFPVGWRVADGVPAWLTCRRGTDCPTWRRPRRAKTGSARLPLAPAEPIEPTIPDVTATPSRTTDRRLITGSPPSGRARWARAAPRVRASSQGGLAPTIAQ